MNGGFLSHGDTPIPGGLESDGNPFKKDDEQGSPHDLGNLQVSIILLGNDISVHAWAPFFIFFFGVFECF
jgi:hypothetical protein